MTRKWQVDTPAQIGGLLEAKSGANITGDISVSGNASITGNGTMNGDLNLPTDGKGINFFGGAKIFKKAGNGLKIQAHNDTIGVAIVDTAGNDKLVIKTDGSATGLTYNGATVWTSQNDGSGSGLDADLLDGLHESTFMRKSANSDLTFSVSDVTGAVSSSYGIVWSGLSDSFKLFVEEYNTDTTLRTQGQTRLVLHMQDDANEDYFLIRQYNYATTTTKDLFHVKYDEIKSFPKLVAAAGLYVTGTLAVGTTTVNANREAVIQQSGAGDVYGLAILASGTGNVGGYLWAGTGGFVIDARDNDYTGSKNIHLRTGGNDRLFIDGANGNVGIATTTPAQKLHVVGSIRMTGSLVHDGTQPLPFLTDTGGAKPIQTGGLLVSGAYADQSQVPTNGAYIKGEIKGGGNLTIPGVVKLSKMTYQVTFAAGETSKTITHNLGTTNYMCTLGANSVARHVAWTNKAANTIDIVLDSPYYDGSIVVDVILMAY